jgi:hypothetical protein
MSEVEDNESKALPHKAQTRERNKVLTRRKRITEWTNIN